MPDKTRTTSFGNRSVAITEKQNLVRGVFDNVADRYDIMNDVMSGGLHRLWKKRLVAALHIPADAADYRLLDIAGGTGDIAFQAARIWQAKQTKQVKQAKLNPPAQTRGMEQNRPANCFFHVLDINEAMLKIARRRARQKHLRNMMHFTLGNAEALPLADNSQHAITIAFGIRNVTHIERALAEAVRVLCPGGQFLCLEFSPVSRPLVRQIYDLWSFAIIPKMGQYITGDAGAYHYLVESIRKFPDADSFAEKMTKAGLAHVRYRYLSGGIVALHSGWKL